MSDTPTPRTDALMPDQVHKRTVYDHIQVMESHARQLERELVESKKNGCDTCDAYTLANMQLRDDLVNLAKQRDTLAFAMKCIERHGVIMGSTGDYRQGQLDALKSVKVIASEALAATKGGDA